MKWVRFSKYTAGDLGIDPQALMQALAPFFLNSGFASPYSDWNPNTLEALKQAIREVLESGELFPEDSRSEMLEQLAAMSPEELDQLLDNLVKMLMEDGHISLDGETAQAEGMGGGEGQTRFEVTDKSLDFLGYKALKDLLGSLANPASAGTIPATWPPESTLRVLRANMNLATR
jgi:Ca-activated chloride channel family protein